MIDAEQERGGHNGQPLGPDQRLQSRLEKTAEEELLREAGRHRHEHEGEREHVQHAAGADYLSVMRGNAERAVPVFRPTGK